MPKLVIKKGDGIVKKLAVPDEMEAFTVGCEKGNDIIIKDDIISFFHLQFEKAKGTYFVRDLQSQWGTFVNGTKISVRTQLKDCDEVRLGDHIIVFMENGVTPSPPTTPATVAPSVPQTPAPRPTVRTQTSVPRHSLSERMTGVPSLNKLNAWLSDTDVSDAPVRAALHSQENGAAQQQAVDYDTKPAPAHHSDDHFSPGQENGNGYSEQDYKNGSNGEHSLPEIFESDAGNLLEEERLEKPHTVERPDLTFSDSSHDDSSHDTIEPQLPDDATDGLLDDPGVPAASEVATQLYLLGIYGYYLGRKFKVKSPETRLGRDRKLNDIVIKKNAKGELDQAVSRRHATLRFKNNRWFILDKRSKSRTWLNQQKLDFNEEARIRPDDEIEIKSDAKSHIFRVVEEGDWDYAFPKRAGGWTVRCRIPVFNALSVVMILLSMFMIFQAIMARRLLTSQPDPVEIADMIWGASDIDSKFEPAADGKYAIYPAIADVNKDDFTDLIYVNNQGLLSCVNGRSKEPLWTNHDFQASRSFPVTLADIYNSGTPAAVVVSTDDRLRVIDGKWGLEMWKSPILAGPFTGPPVAADFNKDGLTDLALGSVENAIYIGLSSMKGIRWVKMDLQEPILGIASVADVNADSFPELLLGSETGKVLFIDPIKQKTIHEINVNEELNKATGRFDQNNQIRFPIASADLNGDGTTELIICTQQNNLLIVDSTDRSRLWYSMNDGDDVAAGLTAIALGDLDGDGLTDVVKQTSSGQILAFQGKGAGKDRETLLWDFRTPGQEVFMAQPMLADFDKNGTKDVVVVGKLGSLYVLEGATGNTLLRHQAMETKLVSQPLLGDIDNDNYLDILALFSDGRFHTLASNSLTPFGVTWGQAYGNAWHTSKAALPTINSGKYIIQIISSLCAILLIVGLQFLVRRTRSKLSYY